MTTCANCGAPLGVGRYCTNCGHRVGVPVTPAPGLHDTAERPVVLPAGSPAETVEAPPVHEPPPPARFPLFADETVAAPVTDARRVDLPAVATAPVPPASRGRRRPAGAVAAAVVVAALVAGVGFVVATRDDGGAPARAQDPAPVTGSSTDPMPDADGDGPGPDADGPTPEPAAGDPADTRDLTSEAVVTAPPPGPPSSDVATGRTVTYVADNMLDGDPTTCWRTPGDATGAELVFTLPPGSTVSSVSLVNGYAKTSRSGASIYDWYQGNRRLLAVEWSFDDGTTVRQDLIETRDPQRLDVGAIRTDTVRLRLVQVSPPGTGPAAKDNTAISEVTILGT